MKRVNLLKFAIILVFMWHMYELDGWYGVGIVAWSYAIGWLLGWFLNEVNQKKGRG